MKRKVENKLRFIDVVGEDYLLMSKTVDILGRRDIVEVSISKKESGMCVLRSVFTGLTSKITAYQKINNFDVFKKQ